MAMGPRLELRQSQTLVMTPQLQQAIKLLQLSNLELAEFVEQELERNPLLERDEGDGGEDDAPGEGGGGGKAADEPKTIESADGEETIEIEPGGPEETFDGEAVLGEMDGLAIAAGQGDAEDGLDSQYADVHPEDSASDTAEARTADRDDPSFGPDDGGLGTWGQGGGGGLGNDDLGGIEQAAGGSLTLKDHLLEQLHIAIVDPAARLIGGELIESLDEAGYLTEDLESLSWRLGAAEAEIEAVLVQLQRFDPTGVFARDLAECLALQLQELDRYDPAMQALIANLTLLAKHDLPALMRLCEVDAEDLREMIQEVRALNPKPGLLYDTEVAQTVVPDVFVRERPDGGWAVELNTSTLPRVLVNSRYYAEVNAHARNKEEKAYISECANSANWLVKSLDQRARTILKVASELVRQQDAFFAKGVRHLKPLNLKSIAEAIEMHESTVSRVTANKYMATQRGIFELKYFFTSAIASSAGGDAHSAEAVRHRIRDLIEQEDAKKILSDDKLVELLNEFGIDIARRTVAKYREAMHIPSSVQRRRIKRMAM